jgi:hypothetical protein
MWLFTKHGFFSVVKHKDPAGRHKLSFSKTVMIRARRKAHLEDLIGFAKSRKMTVDVDIVETPESDYRFRIWISQDGLSELLAHLAFDVDYSNFKEMIHEKRPSELELHRALTSVWSIMGRLQPGGPYNTRRSWSENQLALEWDPEAEEVERWR